jgi:predicted metal-binding membrane protein
MASSAPDLTTRLLRRERLIVAGGLALLVLLCWLFVIDGAGMPTGMAAMQTPPFGALVLMWWLMMLAMMVPSAAPAVLLYGRVRQIRGGDAQIGATSVFLGGYLATWLAFSLIAALAQKLLTGPSMTLDNRFLEAGVLLAAGVYQLSPLKAACLRECRSPAEFISRHWRPGWDGAVRLGVRHGLYCLGCCWTLMALLFVGGVMNLVWVVALTLVVATEKLAPAGRLVGRAAGVLLIAWALAKLTGF